MTFAIITAALISGAVADRMKFSAWVRLRPALGGHRLLPDGAHGLQLHRGLAHLRPHRRPGLRGRHGRPHQRRHRGPRARAAARQADRLAARADAPAQPDADHARRRPAVDGLVRLQRRLDRLRRRRGRAFDAHFFSETGRTFATTTLATMAAILGWLAVERLVHKKATSLGAASGIVAGLVAITPATGAVNLSGAVAIGAIAGAVCAWAVGLKYKLGYDDSLDVVGVHLVGGIIGTVLIGVFSTVRGRRRHRRPALRRRVRLAGRPGPRCRRRDPLLRRPHRGHRASRSSTRSACASTRMTRSTVSTSPPTASRRTTCTAAPAVAAASSPPRPPPAPAKTEGASA